MNEKYNGGEIIERGGGFYFVRENSEAGAFLTIAGLKKHFPITKTQEDIDQTKDLPENFAKNEEIANDNELEAKSEKASDDLEPVAKKLREKRAKNSLKTAEVQNSDETPITESEAKND